MYNDIRRLYTSLKRFLSYLKYRKHFRSIGKKVTIRKSVKIQGNNITIGDYSRISHQVFIQTMGGVSIGRYVMLSPFTKILSGGLDTDLPYNINDKNIRPHISKKIVIDDGAWIGADSIILMGVKIGEGAVVAAGSVVTKDVEPYVLVAGNPAKVIRKLNIKNK